MKHELIFLGKTKDNFIAQGIENYASRLKHYSQVLVKTLKEKKSGGQINIEEEGRQLLDAVPGGWLKVALDSRGRQYTSEDFAELISGWEQRGVKGVCYLIGGPTGLSSEVVDGADVCLSLSKMTFTHDMVRMLLMEQLYRAYTIKGGEKYHK
ncbi:23S rRNA (pseudouridine(1915)-N(3))-methyltransferase RlmH [Desulfopila aestuarii]|uniref:Ribosomal RNA large subunit methyltransferase H n=1 Tax=Desulfopila aestuarii DSM 18488 TaxID=1121416 RepID=A0A1M7Y216_9BACT|nr:23S rRNA (pseudouridine(1915)-N(3))-methyltransferase RlmH [Desulfopila aestuarii]SHO45944.1 23S rRNA (pseudouridine1915-N3)-methyltransferase [Desulfopila aestuarii DSM 18488]